MGQWPVTGRVLIMSLIRVRGETPTSTQWVAACASVALVPMIIVHVVGVGLVDPIIQPVSHYAYVPGGYPMVLLGSITLAAAALALSRGLGRSGFDRMVLPQRLLISFAVAMILVGLLPTDPPGTLALSPSATIHRWSAAYAFAVLPVIGFVVAARGCPAGAGTGTVALRRLSIGVTVGVGTFFVIHLPMLALGSQIPMFGLVERIGFVFMISFMVVLANATRPAAAADPDVPTLPESEEVLAAVRAAGDCATALASGHESAALGAVPARPLGATGRAHPMPHRT